jgi:diguanylate cyclase (GGDEF)-like protein
MHLIDFVWGVLSLAGAAVPVYRLYDNRHRPGAPYLLSLVIVCALYPWAYIVHPYTLFDQGLVFAFTSWIGPLYLLGVFSYLGVARSAWSWIRIGTLMFAAAMSVLAITNPFHGAFATFREITPSEPLTTIGQAAHGIVIATMGGFSIACIMAAVIVIGFYYHRSRFHFSHLVALTLFPVMSGLAYLLQDEIKQFVSDSVNTFILCTTAGLGVLTYTMLRHRFLELRPIAREMVLNLIPDAMAIVARDGVVVDCNSRFAELLGWSIGTTIGANLSGQLPEEAWLLGPEHKTTRSVQLDIGGASRFFEIHLVRLDHRDKRGEVLVLFRDITEQTLAHNALRANQAELKALNEELARLSSTDTLTGLRNRRHFLEQLNQECERAKRQFHSFALLSIDLDNFKLINDSHGHAAGDEALVHAARAMQTQCRTADTLARVGGEEFMVLLLNIGESELGNVAERFRLAIERTAMSLNNGEPLSLTASIGGAVIQPHVSTQLALRRIDEALYAAKRAGRNRVVLNSTGTPRHGAEFEHPPMDVEATPR